jgi:hypothetical protein
MFITPEMEYPMVCVSVKQSYQQDKLRLELINMNTGATWFHSDELDDMDGTGTFGFGFKLLQCSVYAFEFKSYCGLTSLVNLLLAFN